MLVDNSKRQSPIMNFRAMLFAMFSSAIGLGLLISYLYPKDPIHPIDVVFREFSIEELSILEKSYELETKITRVENFDSNGAALSFFVLLSSPKEMGVVDLFVRMKKYENGNRLIIVDRCKGLPTGTTDRLKDYLTKYYYSRFELTNTLPKDLERQPFPTSVLENIEAAPSSPPTAQVATARRNFENRSAA